MFHNCRLDGKVVVTMEVFEMIQCPFCAQGFELAIDTSVASQSLTTDCEVCCRPFVVRLESQPGRILSLEVSVD
jgi:hypothetical protein